MGCRYPTQTRRSDEAVLDQAHRHYPVVLNANVDKDRPHRARRLGLGAFQVFRNTGPHGGLSCLIANLVCAEHLRPWPEKRSRRVPIESELTRYCGGQQQRHLVRQALMECSSCSVLIQG